MPTYPDYYLTWAREDAGIDAPKVETRSIETPEGDQRGLFATDTIYPGERLIWIPSKALIGADHLKALGQTILNQDQDVLTGYLQCHQVHHHQQQPHRKDIECKLEHWERCLVGFIEEFRQFTENGVDEQLSTIVKSLDYQWRDDDGVALYLMACQILIAYRRHLADSLEEGEAAETKDVNIATENPEDAAEERTSEQEAPIVFGQRQAAAEEDGGSHPETEVVVEVEPETLQVSQHNHSKAVEDSPDNQYPSFLPHVDMLPSSFPTCPLYYTEEELSRIEGTNCHGFTVRMLQQMQADWSKLTMVLQAFAMSEHRFMKCPTCGSNSTSNNDDEDAEGNDNNNETEEHDICWSHILNPHKGYLSYYAYKWALCNIYSRSTDFALNNDKPNNNNSQDNTTKNTSSNRRVIAPVFDMINHDFDSSVNHALDQDGNLSVFNGADRTIEKGEEILLNYGNFPNEKLLLVYGFVVTTPKNENDAVQIYAPLSPSDPLYTVKERLLRTKGGIDNVNAPHLLKLPVQDNSRQAADENDNSWENTTTTSSSNSILPASLLSVLRVIGVQDPDEILAIGSQGDSSHNDSGNDDHHHQGIGMISGENERSALEALHGALEGMARQLALNMISDDNLNAGRSRDVQQDQLLSSEEEEAVGFENQGNITEEDDAGQKLRRMNLQNAKVLCRSEYAILQAALGEISNRLNQLV